MAAEPISFKNRILKMLEPRVIERLNLRRVNLLADMLGTRRTSVSVVAENLQHKSLIQSSAGEL